jgi:hypothetical protein
MYRYIILMKNTMRIKNLKDWKAALYESIATPAR